VVQRGFGGRQGARQDGVLAQQREQFAGHEGGKGGDARALHLHPFAVGAGQHGEMPSSPSGTAPTICVSLAAQDVRHAVAVAVDEPGTMAISPPGVVLSPRPVPRCRQDNRRKGTSIQPCRLPIMPLAIRGRRSPAQSPSRLDECGSVLTRAAITPSGASRRSSTRATGGQPIGPRRRGAPIEREQRREVRIHTWQGTGLRATGQVV
jgi:hypothetical protein